MCLPGKSLLKNDYEKRDQQGTIRTVSLMAINCLLMQVTHSIVERLVI